MAAKIAAPSKQRPSGGDSPVVRVHIWLEKGKGLSFGLGRMQLLEAIERLGSLKAAAESLGMSYRAAWGKIKGSEDLLGQPLIEKLGGNRSGYTLTDFGRRISECYRIWFRTVELTAVHEAERLFPFQTRSFGQALSETEQD